MSTRVIDYLDYSHENFVTEERTPDPAPRRTGAIAFSGLSPFDVPEQVEIEIRSNGSCLLRLKYPDSEHGEPSLRPVIGEAGVRVLLGRKTGKVLMIDIANGQARISQGQCTIDLRTLPDLESDERSRELHTLNADLVSSIASKALSDLRPELLRAWSGKPAGSQSRPSAT